MKRKPACMDDEEFASWTSHNESIHPMDNRVSSPCSDCIESFAAEMRKLDSCDGRPGVQSSPEFPSLAERGMRGVETRRKNKEAKIDVALELRRQGFNQTQIAARMNVSRTAVWKYFRQTEGAA